MSQEDTIAQLLFMNQLRSLYNIDGAQLPELSMADQYSFVRDPVYYLLHADDEQADAIWREVSYRQKPRMPSAATAAEHAARIAQKAHFAVEAAYSSAEFAAESAARAEDAVRTAASAAATAEDVLEIAASWARGEAERLSAWASSNDAEMQKDKAKP